MVTKEIVWVRYWQRLRLRIKVNMAMLFPDATLMPELGTQTQIQIISR